MINDLNLIRLLQLVSPGLPIGMYCYSQGLERAIEDGLVTNAQETGVWISALLEHCQAKVDLPIAMRLYDAWQWNDCEEAENWSRILLSHRETSELREEDRQTGQAMARLLSEMEMHAAIAWLRKPETTLAAMFSLAAVKWGVSKRMMLNGLLWSWLENQVLCAVKIVPLGQVAGQQLLHELGELIPDLMKQAVRMEDDEIGGSVFGLGLASSRHEMQYSRLFRS